MRVLVDRDRDAGARHRGACNAVAADEAGFDFAAISQEFCDVFRREPAPALKEKAAA